MNRRTARRAALLMVGLAVVAGAACFGWQGWHGKRAISSALPQTIRVDVLGDELVFEPADEPAGSAPPVQDDSSRVFKVSLTVPPAYRDQVLRKLGYDPFDKLSIHATLFPDDDLMFLPVGVTMNRGPLTVEQWSSGVSIDYEIEVQRTDRRRIDDCVRAAGRLVVKVKDGDPVVIGFDVAMRRPRRVAGVDHEAAAVVTWTAPRRGASPASGRPARQRGPAQ
jgi:hypothetical protein